jgi:hypothetical protein
VLFKGSFAVLPVAALLNSCNLETKMALSQQRTLCFVTLAAETPDQGAKTISPGV